MRVVYFDGLCNLCNGFVDFLIRRDHRRRLKYAPLQGAFAAAQLPVILRESLSTLVLQDDAQIYTESNAAIYTIAHLGGVYQLAKIFLLVPGFVRNAIYRWVANHRYHFAGRRETCRLPSAEERAQFLD